MWINLDERELQLFQQRVPELAHKIRQRNEDHEKFFNFACRNSNDDVEIDSDAVVSQGDSGGYVMSWYWVSNMEAGIDTEEEDDE